jgi:acyl dehydratase
MPKEISLSEVKDLVGSEVGISDWITVDQAMIDAFAKATLDDQFIHTDPERAAAESPFGGTIAHGFLTLSLLSVLAFGALPGVRKTRMGINYGFDRVRFMNPVKSGARVRGKFQLVGITERAVSVQSAWASTVEIEGGLKPALVAHWITLAVLDPDAAD